MTSSKVVKGVVHDICFKYQELLCTRDYQFLQRVYATPEKRYANRLKAVGFCDRSNVLDAGCGFGQWSLALAHLNKRVCAVDVHIQRLRFLREIVEKSDVKNLHVKMSLLEQLPYDDNAFDAVFCYGVLFCTDWKKTLREFYRVMKKGAVLYLTATGIGWYAHLWKNKPNETHDYNPRLYAAQSFMNTVQYNNAGTVPRYADVIIEQTELTDYLSVVGFHVMAVGDEGTLRVNKNGRKPKPFFKGEYYGLEGVYEILAKKGTKVK